LVRVPIILSQDWCTDFLRVNGVFDHRAGGTLLCGLDRRGSVRTASAEVGGNDGNERNAEGPEQLKVEAGSNAGKKLRAQRWFRPLRPFIELKVSNRFETVWRFARR